MSKKQENKYDPSLTSYELIKAISDVRQYGIDKHGYRDEWFTTHPNEHFKSAMRHLIAAINGEEYDVSGLPHIAHAVTNLAFELERGNYAFNRKYENEKEKDKYSRQLNLHL
jgi:hypothetical protein